MRSRSAVSGAVLSLWVVLAWTGGSPPEHGRSPSSPDASTQIRGGGSEAPCAVPLRWRVTRVDREFGLGIAEAAAVVQEAASLWEEGAGRQLFALDDTGGFPIRLVYDERQQRTQERVARESELAARASILEASQLAIATRARAHMEAGRAHRERVTDLDRRVAAHNTTVRAWNERGGAPPETRMEMEAVGAALEAERLQLEAEGRTLDEENRAIREAEEQLNREAARYDRLLDELNEDLPPVQVRSGEYREAVQKVGGRVVGISREIRIYRFASADELRLIAAHELGHALGLGHVPSGDAVMAEQHESGTGSSSVESITAADAALLTATCPQLAREGR